MYWVSLVLVSLALGILKKAKKLHLIIVFKYLGKIIIYLNLIYLYLF